MDFNRVVSVREKKGFVSTLVSLCRVGLVLSSVLRIFHIFGRVLAGSRAGPTPFENPCVVHFVYVIISIPRNMDGPCPDMVQAISPFTAIKSDNYIPGIT